MRPFSASLLLLLPALLLGCHKDAPEQTKSTALTFTTVRTLAGSGRASHLDGTGTTAQFFGPAGMAIDAQGIIYVAGNGDACIRKVTAAGVVTTLAGTGRSGNLDGPVAQATFGQPLDVKLDSQGNLYVADASNHCIRKITPAGVVSTFAGGRPGLANGPGASAQFLFPAGLAVDAQDNLYVADQDNSCIRKITPAGVVSTLAGNGTSGGDDGTGAAARFNSPGSLAIGPQQVLYVSERDGMRIRKVTLAGQVTTLAGGSGRGNADGPGQSATFGMPEGLAVDASGTVYVADGFNNTIRRVAADGTVTTLTGTGRAGFADGPLQSAQFTVPNGLTLDANGQLLLTEYGNRIRVISAQ